MRTNQSMVGVGLICRISLILRRTILKPRWFSWKKTTVQPRKFSRRPTKLSRITATAVQRNFGLKMTTVNKSFITVLMTSVMKLFLLLQLLITSFVKKVRTSRISLYFTVPMLSLVLLKKPCSSLISLIPWLEVPSSIAVKKSVMSFLT